MLEAKDLRIGNLIQISGKVQCVYARDIDKIHIGDSCLANLAKPIPLTEEWFLKFGFEPDKDNTAFTNWDNFAITILSIEEGFCLYDGDSMTYQSRPIQYVHELQNLYRWLIGEELEIKETLT